MTSQRTMLLSNPYGCPDERRVAGYRGNEHHYGLVGARVIYNFGTLPYTGEHTHDILHNPVYVPAIAFDYSVTTRLQILQRPFPLTTIGGTEVRKVVT